MIKNIRKKQQTIFIFVTELEILIIIMKKEKSSLLITHKLICFFMFKFFPIKFSEKKETGLLFTQKMVCFFTSYVSNNNYQKSEK